MDLELYQKLMLHAAECGYKHQNDSELIRISLNRFLNADESNRLTIHMMQEQINKQKVDLIKAQEVIDLHQGLLRYNRKAKKIKDHNIKIKKKRDKK